MGYVQIYVDLPNTSDHDENDTRAPQLERQLRSALEDLQQVRIEDMAVRTQANIDPNSLAELTTLLYAAAGTIGGGAAILLALRKFATQAGALVRTIRLEIAGKPKPIEAVTAEELDAEIASGAG